MPEHSDEVIPNLKFTLTDALGNQVRMQYHKGDSLIDTLAYLWQNPKKSGTSYRKPSEYRSIKYPFIEDEYIWIDGPFKENIWVRIEDVDGDENGGFFYSQNVVLTEADYHSLCTDFGSWYEDHKQRKQAFEGARVVRLKSNKRYIHKERSKNKAACGRYVLDKDKYGNAEVCGFRKVKLKRSGKIVLIDDVLPMNCLEIPNTRKVYGYYHFENDSTINIQSTKEVGQYVRIGAPRWFRKIYDKKRVVNKELQGDYSMYLHNNSIYRQRPQKYPNKNQSLQKENSNIVSISSIINTCIFIKR